jgi:selT/selW/selH-like putative selenoprotein
VAELQQAFPGIETKLVPSSGGVFDVMVDGALVFSKRAVGRHAKPGEVVDLIRGVS